MSTNHPNPSKRSRLQSNVGALTLSEPMRLSHSPAGLNKSIGEERGSSRDTVTARQGQGVTLCEPVLPLNGQDHGVTESPLDPVTTRQSHAVTLSDEPERKKFPTSFKRGELKPVDHFCAVPGVLLQGARLFESTFDFVVYLRMFAKSYGFGRNTCDMGLNELIEYSGLARNSVKKSIERLVEQKWIKVIQDYECGRVTRKWRVYSPYEMGHSPHPTFR